VDSIIALSGKTNVGKSRTIKIVYELLKQNYPTLKVLIEPAETKVEIRVVIIINGKRVGIESRGDTREIVEKALDIFTDTKCNIIICATRTRGGSWNAVQEFANSNHFELKRIQKIPVETEVLQISSNKKYAKELMGEIKLLLAESVVTIK